MSRSLRPMLVALGLALLAAGCGGPTRAWSASFPEYDAFRRSRVAPAIEDRLAAAWQYLSDYPEGAYYEEVLGWFGRVEPAYYASAQNSRARLEAYLEALPDGPHAKLATQRVLELERAATGRKTRDQKELTRARRVQDEIQAAADSRTEFLALVTLWVGHLASIDSWGGRTHELNHELLFDYRMQTPQAKCGDTQCIKTLGVGYRIPDDGTMVSREAVLDVVLELADGVVTRARITGPDLFSRIGEATRRGAVRPDDAQARAESIAHSTRVVARALDSRFPEARCGREIVAPVVLGRACGGVRATMIASEQIGGEDQIVIEPFDPEPGGPDGVPPTP